MSAHFASEGSEIAPVLPLLESRLLHAGPRIQGLVQIGDHPQPLIPARKPGPGEQYRFHFDMKKCIGCKCCVVACNEQNGNPAGLNWRRVGEIEGGHFPYTQRHHLSMGCNHCLEPSCLKGCPVKAYTKSPETGVVIHDADTCIGCQYCTWNCSYGVPQYNAERGVVGKCDMCHNRLADDMAPACVSACPEGAISIEIVNVAEWRQNYGLADAPGLPSADDSVSTTRITLPAAISPDTGRVDTNRVRPEHPHWPLVLMLVATQLSIGAFAALWILDLNHAGGDLRVAALGALVLAALSLASSTLHLGRPIHAWRALSGLATSWLSREVLTLGLFAGAAASFAGMLLFHLPATGMAGAATVAFGIAGATCSARIYMVPARPAWSSGYTLGEFFSTALLLGPAFVRLLEPGAPKSLLYAAVAGASVQISVQMLKFLWMVRSETFELRSSGMLLSGELRSLFLTRLAILVVCGVVAPFVFDSPFASAAAFMAVLAGEFLGRYLFFVSVVPKNMAAAFTSAGVHA